MWCPSCALLIREVLLKREGVVEAEVFFFSDLVRVRYLPHRTTLQTAMQEVVPFGYRPLPVEDPSGAEQEKKRMLLRLGVSSLLTMNIMGISFALYGGFFQELGDGAAALLSYPLWILTTAVLFYGGYPILSRAYAGLRNRVATMDTLIAIGALAAYGCSISRMGESSLHLYFDTSAMLITLVLLGRFIERHARDRASQGINELYHLARQKVRRIMDGRERWVVPETVRSGDLFEAREGETVSVDGRVISGRASVDESFLTGENRPLIRVEGDVIPAGSVVVGGSARLRACSEGDQSTLRRMVGLFEEALALKSPVERIADRITGLAVPAVLLLSAGTALVLAFSGGSWGESLLRGMTVLVITCPCALGIAAPLAKVATLGAARRQGILIGRSDGPERSSGLGAMVLDKTGTVTEGRFSLRRVTPAEGETREGVLARAASVEAHSDHFIAREILKAAREHGLAWDPCEGLSVSEGFGVSGSLEGEEVLVGNREWMRLRGAALPPWMDREAAGLEGEGQTVVFAAWGKSVRGLLALGDKLREEAKGTVASFRQKGFEVWLVSGDSAETTAAIASSLGIDHHVGRALPEDKREIVRSIQRSGRRVAMVGDGINDAAALAQADLGIAFGTRSGLLRQAGDFTILAEDLQKVSDALTLSLFSTRIIRENLFFSFFYNLFGIPLAMTGVLNPILAVTAMFASSLTVIGNTLRITRKGVRSKQ